MILALLAARPLKSARPLLLVAQLLHPCMVLGLSFETHPAAARIFKDKTEQGEVLESS